MENTYQVVVGNIGTVYDGNDLKDATEHYNAYIFQSKKNIGRVAGEDVTLFKDLEIHKEYIGNNSNFL